MTVRIVRQEIDEVLKLKLKNGYPVLYTGESKKLNNEINLDDFQYQIFSHLKKAQKTKNSKKSQDDGIKNEKPCDTSLFFWEPKREKSMICSVMVVKVEDFHDGYPKISLYLFPSHYEAFSRFAHMFYRNFGFKGVGDFMKIFKNLMQEYYLGTVLDAMPIEPEESQDVASGDDSWDNSDYKL